MRQRTLLRHGVTKQLNASTVAGCRIWSPFSRLPDSHAQRRRDGVEVGSSRTAVGGVGRLVNGDVEVSRCGMPSRGCACTTRRRAAANGGGGWTSVMIWCEPVKAQFTHAADRQQDVCVRRLLAPMCGRRCGGWTPHSPSQLAGSDESRGVMIATLATRRRMREGIRTPHAGTEIMTDPAPRGSVTPRPRQRQAPGS